MGSRARASFDGFFSLRVYTFKVNDEFITVFGSTGNVFFLLSRRRKSSSNGGNVFVGRCFDSLGNFNFFVIRKRNFADDFDGNFELECRKWYELCDIYFGLRNGPQFLFRDSLNVHIIDGVVEKLTLQVRGIGVFFNKCLRGVALSEAGDIHIFGEIAEDVILHLIELCLVSDNELNFSGR